MLKYKTLPQAQTTPPGLFPTSRRDGWHGCLGYEELADDKLPSKIQLKL